MAVDPLFLVTAIEAVLRSGDIQMERFGRVMRVDKKGTIDLVTEVDLAVERMFRDLIDERFPDHQVLAEEMGSGAPVPPGPCWVFDPIDGTTNYAHGLPIFCASLALELDGVAVVGAIYDPNRKELFTAERGGGAFLNAVSLAPPTTATLVDAMLDRLFPYDVHDRAGRDRRPVRRVRRRSARGPAPGSAAIDLCYVAAGRMDGFWERDPPDVAAGGASSWPRPAVA